MQVDDIGLDEIMEQPPAGRRLASVHRTLAFRWVRVLVQQNENPHLTVWVLILVDDIGLEPMTFRTSSGCSSQLS